MTSGKAQQAGFTVALDEGGLPARRRTSLLPDGCYLFEDALRTAGTVKAKVITCTAWLLELYQLSSGEMSFASDSKRVAPRTKTFGAFFPPYTISALCFKDVQGYVIGVAGTHELPSEFIKAPALFETGFSGAPANVTQVLQILRTSTSLQSVDAHPNPSLLSLKARRLIAENYLDYPSIARIAQRLGVTAAHLSRQFKADFEMSPSNYLHELRLADVPLRLARGEDIVNVSENVGYNDLSRFYKQFHKRTSASPGACRDLLKPRPA